MKQLTAPQDFEAIAMSYQIHLDLTKRLSLVQLIGVVAASVIVLVGVPRTSLRTLITADMARI